MESVANYVKVPPSIPPSLEGLKKFTEY